MAVPEAVRVPFGPMGEGWRLTGPGGRVVAEVCPAAGGEVSSLRMEPRGEVLYRANEFEAPPEGQWRGRAPLLWPAVGRNFTPAALRQPEPACGFDLDGQHYPLPIHGFARDAAFEVLGHGASDEAAWVRLGLRDSPATRAVYPWPFALEVEHRAAADRLVTTVTLTSTETIPFGIGNHLTVAIPRETFGEATIRGQVDAQFLLTANSLLSGELTPADLSTPRPLSESRWHNTVLHAADWPAELTVTWPDGFALTVGQEVTAGDQHVRPEDRLWVFYGNPAMGYYCPEPWIGRPNGLQDPDGRVTLPAGETFTWQMTLRIGG